MYMLKYWNHNKAMSDTANTVVVYSFKIITFIAIYGKCHLSKKNKSSGITLIILVTNILSKRDNSKSLGAGT